jgi:AcrR family transcriptional regulator
MTTRVDQGRPWRGLSPAQRQQARRRRLLDAGLELFGTVGYAGTSLTGLCAEGGVSPRHFYDIHPGREQLLGELYLEIAADVGRQVQAAVAAAPLTVAGQIESGLAAVVAAVTDDPRRARVLLVEIVGVSPELDAMRRVAVRRFSAVLAEAHARLVVAGAVSPRAFGAVSIGLVGAVNELLTDWLLKDPRPPASSVLPPLTLILTAVFEFGQGVEV